MPYHPLTLSFTGEWSGLEPEFLAYYHRDSLTRSRIALVVATLLYGLFGILDAVVVPEQAHIFWIIRYGVVIPMALAGLAFSFHPAFEKYSQQVLFIIILAGGLGIELMVMLADPPANYSYYAGVILVFIVLHTFIRLRFLWASACSLTMVIAYEIIAIWIIDTPFTYLVNNNFFFISSMFLCMLAGYTMELNTRRVFFSTRLLTLEKEKVQAANEDLDQRVKERTEELSRANQRLHQEMHERLQAQEQRLELEKNLNQRQKVEAVGTLAGGIAHDFNNILAAIIGYTELIREDALLDEILYSQATEILKAAHRAKELTSQILTFSRQAEQDFKPVHIKPVVQEAVKMLRASIPSTVHIQSRLNSEAHVFSDPTQIHRMVVNLCTNGYQALENQTGILDLRLEDICLDEKTRIGDSTLPPGAYVKFTVMDTGCGMAPELVKQIFDPFFTTRDVNQGTGMGLAVVHGVVKKARGGIAVDSTPGKGSVFTLFLPATAPAARGDDNDTAPDREAPVPKGNGEHILFVDDETVLVNLMRSTLPSLNYRATGVLSPQQGFEVLETEDIDLLITDFSMPQMNGLEFAARVSQDYPGLPILLSTGYSESVTREKMAAAGIREMIMKPLTRMELGRKLGQMLDKD